MDGTNRTLLIALEYPSYLFGLTVHNSSLYWCNISHQAINYINLNDPRHTIKTIFLSRDLSHPSALTSLAGVLYLLSRGPLHSRNGSIVAIDGESGLVTSKVAWHLRDGLDSFCAVDFNVSIAAVSNACLHNNGNCSYLCLLTPFGASCACPNEMTLTADGKTCYLREFLIYVDTSIPEGIYKIPLDNIPSRPDKLPLKISQYPSHIDLDFDPIESYVYWTSDVSHYSIMRAHLNGSDQKAIISRDLTRPLGLAVDMIGRNIYWTDLDRGVIEVAKLDGSYRKVLVKNIAGPRSIVLDGIRGFMYWSSYLDHDIKPARIERSYMDATNQTLIKELSPRHHLFPYAFTIDPYINRLYWLQFYDKNLYFTDLDDPFFHIYQYYSSNHLLVSSGLAVSEKNIYWSKGGIDAGIYRISKGSGTSSPEKLVALRGEALDVHVYHNTSMAIPASHACTVNNGHCTHLCLVIPDGYKCACPDDPSHGWPCYEVPLPPTLKPAVIHTTSTENILTTTTTVLSSSSSPSSITASTSILTLITPKTIQPSPLKLRTTFTTLTQESTSYHTQTMTTVGHPSQQPCKSNPCFHNSKCVEVNGAFKCRCQEGFASRLCNVYYGIDKITITIAVPIKMWHETLFKMAMVEMLNSFCSRNFCSFNNRTRQRRRSSSSSFETSNIVIVNGPISVPAGIQIQIAVLQSHLAHVTQTLPSHLLCRIVRDSEKNLLNGYDIVAINGEAHPKCQASPISGKTNNKHTSSFSSLVWIVIFVVVLVVMAVLSVACFYERRKRHQLLEEPCTAQQVTFHNPGYIEDSNIVNDPFSESTYENMSHNDEFFQSKQHKRDLHPLVGNTLYFMTETSLTVEKPRSSHNTPGKFEACLTTEKSLVKEDSDSSCKDSVKIDNRVGIADQGNLWQENTESRQNSGDKDDCVHRYVSISPMISRRYQRTEHLYATIGDDEDGAQCASILESPQHDKQPLKLDESIVNLYEEMNQCFKVDDTVNAVPDIEVTYQDGAFSEKVPTNIPGEKRTRENVNDVISPLTVESTLGNTTEGSRAPGEKRTHENASHVDGPLVKTAPAEIKTYENIDDMEHPSVNETFGNSREHARSPEEKRTYENIDDIEGPLPIKESCQAPQQQRTYGDIKGTSSKDKDTSHSIGAPVEMSTSDDDHSVPMNNNQLECNVVKIQGIDNKDESFT